MKPPRFLVLVFLVLLFGCAHKVAIHATEPDTYIHVDGIALGKAPVMFEEKSGIPQTYQFAVTKEGHVPNYVELKQSHVNFPTHAFATVAPVPVMAIGGLIVAGGGPWLPVALGGMALILGPQLYKFQLDDSYLLPVGEPGESPLSEDFLRLAAERKVSQSSDQVTTVTKKSCGALVCP